DGPPATVLRLSDEAETAIGLARPQALGAAGGGAPGGCLAILGWEGHEEDVAARREATGRRLRAAGGEPVAGAGDGWVQGRYRGPYLRDALLDAGALVDTLETVTFWSRLPGLYASVSEALRARLTELGSPPVILCHISHSYPAGAALYFTVACAAREDPVAQWRSAKAAAGRAILDAGGSISHHHGIGSDHVAEYAQEIGPLGLQALRAVKARLDPAGIMNPGILV
ncbi:MAG TPA: FAD-linked oxidase C-terminal domain-containing protein, partial [Solirubrobacteraceae bacterium]|nr:FAD-linked oxidase C-terminal domain-containing protein [Solirubrobacteraceae bacterium]